jgi:hypothetical protein
MLGLDLLYVLGTSLADAAVGRALQEWLLLAEAFVAFALYYTIPAILYKKFVC